MSIQTNFKYNTQRESTEIMSVQLGELSQNEHLCIISAQTKKQTIISTLETPLYPLLVTVS